MILKKKIKDYLHSDDKLHSALSYHINIMKLHK